MTIGYLTTDGLDGVTLTQAYYGTLGEATAWFQSRLHARGWLMANPDKRAKALLAATQIIDRFAFKGQKAAVAALCESAEKPTPAEVRAADASQELEFPRGADTDVPADIRRACYEIADSLLDGRQPDFELEGLAITSTGYGSVRTTYNRTQVPIEHLINGVVSVSAWRLIRPFLRDDQLIELNRVS